VGIIAWIILGLVAGLIAKAVLKGPNPGGLIVTTLLGGSILVLVIWRALTGGRRRRLV
jgi:hypothetical protein